ncbi:COQ9 family protein [Sphingomonas flavalba]|uniref:COQ9 family protein n=1 Tax=Sphingomonas flavalba TaxID=2559804 RepID=UPI0039E1723E
MAMLPDDPTLDEIRAHLAPRLAAHAAFDGWRPAAIDSAAAEAGIDPAVARLAFPGGAVAMIDAWFESVDRAMEAALPPERLIAMKVRERIRALVIARLDAVAGEREALRRAIAVLALPANIPAATRISWRTADRIWRLAGDTAADFNHYSKRLTLSALYTATILVFLDDESPEFAETHAFLDRRIANVIAYEVAKARRAERRGHRPSLSRFIGRLRYPVA